MQQLQGLFPERFFSNGLQQGYTVNLCPVQLKATASFCGRLLSESACSPSGIVMVPPFKHNCLKRLLNATLNSSWPLESELKAAVGRAREHHKRKPLVNPKSSQDHHCYVVGACCLLAYHVPFNFCTSAENDAHMHNLGFTHFTLRERERESAYISIDTHTHIHIHVFILVAHASTNQ